MIKPLFLLPLLAQISIAPSIGEGNIAPAIGEQTKPVPSEPKPAPVAVQSDVQSVGTPEPPPTPVDIPVPGPLAEDFVELAPPLEQPALEDSSSNIVEVLYTPEPSLQALPQTQAPIPLSPAPQPLQPLQRPAGVAYRQPIPPAPTTLTETIGYPLTTRYPVTSGFGWRNHPVNGGKRFHAGIDLGAPHGTPTLSMLSGQIVHADWEGGYGKSIVIEHPGTGLKTRYAHLSKIHVQPGQWVDKGWHVGDSGATGLVTGPHAHIEIIANGQPVDPWPYLAQASRQAILLNRFHPWAG